MSEVYLVREIGTVAMPRKIAAITPAFAVRMFAEDYGIADGEVIRVEVVSPSGEKSEFRVECHIEPVYDVQRVGDDERDERLRKLKQQIEERERADREREAMRVACHVDDEPEEGV